MRTVQESFGPSAAKYAVSAVHKNDQELAWLLSLVAPTSTDRLLDVAAGAGNTAHAFAPDCGQTVALDMTPAMAELALSIARQQGLNRMSVVLGDASKLPFPSASFDIVTNRLAAHHFSDQAAAISETRRVLRTAGKFLLVDNFSPECDQDAIDLDQLERLRDPSHYWSLKASQWVSLLRANRFRILTTRLDYEAPGTRMEVEGWMERIRTPEENRAVLRNMFKSPPAGLNEFIQVRWRGDECSFSLPKITILAEAIE